MDSRTARRAAEKAARDLIATRAALVGELGVADAERTQLAAGVNAAAERGRRIVADAQAEAARLLTAAQDLAAAGEQRYTETYTAATAAGWATSDLTALGFPPSSTNANPRRRRPAHTALPQPAGAAAGAVPSQPTP